MIARHNLHSWMTRTVVLLSLGGVGACADTAPSPDDTDTWPSVDGKLDQGPHQQLLRIHHNTFEEIEPNNSISRANYIDPSSIPGQGHLVGRLDPDASDYFFIDEAEETLISGYLAVSGLPGLTLTLIEDTGDGRVSTDVPTIAGFKYFTEYGGDMVVKITNQSSQRVSYDLNLHNSSTGDDPPLPYNVDEPWDFPSSPTSGVDLPIDLVQGHWVVVHGRTQSWSDGTRDVDVIHVAGAPVGKMVYGDFGGEATDFDVEIRTSTTSLGRFRVQGEYDYVPFRLLEAQDLYFIIRPGPTGAGKEYRLSVTTVDIGEYPDLDG